MASRMKELEILLKERLSSNWISVRKAFLDLDTDKDGFLSAEDFAKVIGGSSGNFDFNILQMYFNIRCKNSSSRMNYTEFCTYFG
jgi:Ca2+-binding EF-hand superfamily protein